MLEALPAVTEPPVSLKLGRSLRNLAASNWDNKRKKYKMCWLKFKGKIKAKLTIILISY
jgi:predicted NAD-dependent protein-ADP-ribosyltransferase YbiA (DUF1768 family)